MVDRLAAEIKTVVTSPEFTEAMAKQGIETVYRDPQAFTSFAAEQSEVFAQIVPELGVQK